MIENRRNRVLAGAAAISLATATAQACPTGHSTMVAAAASDLGCCGSSACPTPGSTLLGGMLDGTGRGTPFPVSIIDNSFQPNAPIIKPNTTVRWTNDGFGTHTTTRNMMWDSGPLFTNDTFDFPFTSSNAGFAYSYDCIFHFGMSGFIFVARFGDTNVDGTVNLTDYNALAGNYGNTGATWETGDFTGDGLVNLSDYNLLAANYGLPIQPAGLLDFNSMMPEPATLGLALPLIFGLAQRRRSSAHPAVVVARTAGVYARGEV